MWDKVLLTDVDGVLLDWESAFKRWMLRHGYPVVRLQQFDTHGIDVARTFDITEARAQEMMSFFNESAWIRKLPPLHDAIKYVRQLHDDHGYVFHCITAFSSDLYAYELRRDNLAQIFGPSVIDRLVILGRGESKQDSLMPYANTSMYWIEDRLENAVLGSRLGLSPILYSHPYNQDVYNRFKNIVQFKQVAYHGSVLDDVRFVSGDGTDDTADAVIVCKDWKQISNAILKRL